MEEQLSWLDYNGKHTVGMDPNPKNVSSTVLEPRACYLACLSKPFVLVFNPGHGEIELLSHLC